jgi:two-component system KDP operon response regulator KdpE
MGRVTKGTLLVIDDDVKLVEALKLYLTNAGYEVIAATDGLEGLQKMYAHRPDLIILDVMMPKMDGWEACHRIREISDVPIIMLTARGQEAEKVRGLKLGADDYVAKPFSLKELEARVEAVLRRTRLPPPTKGDVLYADDELVIDAERWEVSRRGKPLELTATERRLLFYLAENAGRILTHRQILERVWGPEYIDDIDYVKLYIWRLRQKIEEEPSQPRYILTERGIGYKFAKNPSFIKPESDLLEKQPLPVATCPGRVT